MQRFPMAVKLDITRRTWLESTADSEGRDLSNKAEERSRPEERVCRYPENRIRRQTYDSRENMTLPVKEDYESSPFLQMKKRQMMIFICRILKSQFCNQFLFQVLSIAEIDCFLKNSIDYFSRTLCTGSAFFY